MRYVLIGAYLALLAVNAYGKWRVRKLLHESPAWKFIAGGFFVFVGGLLWPLIFLFQPSWLDGRQTTIRIIFHSIILIGLALTGHGWHLLVDDLEKIRGRFRHRSGERPAFKDSAAGSD